MDDVSHGGASGVATREQEHIRIGEDVLVCVCVCEPQAHTSSPLIEIDVIALAMSNKRSTSVITMEPRDV